MGNAKSRYEETTWTDASGGIQDDSETVDGSPASSSHCQITISPTIGVVQTVQSLPVVRNIAPNCEYEAFVGGDQVLCKTKKVDNHGMETIGFDLVTPDDKVLLRMESTPSHRTWTILQVGKPVFEGQRPRPKASGEELYRKAIVQFGKDQQHRAQVFMFTNSTDEAKQEEELDKPIIQVERCIPPNFTGKVMDQWHFQTFTDDSSPLTGYWKRDAICVPGREKMVMDLAKDSDVALHVILTVIATIERLSVKAEYTG